MILLNASEQFDIDPYGSACEEDLSIEIVALVGYPEPKVVVERHGTIQRFVDLA